MAKRCKHYQVEFFGKREIDVRGEMPANYLIKANNRDMAISKARKLARKVTGESITIVSARQTCTVKEVIARQKKKGGR